jgi:hypothetical protein
MKKIIFATFLLFSLNFYSQNFFDENLKENVRTEIVAELLELTGVKIEDSSIIIINFYINPVQISNSSCIDHYTSDYSYNRYLKKNKNITQFFVTEKMYVYKKKNVVEDKNGIIRKLLFENATYCGNYIIILPDGKFYRRYGEYRQDEIPFLITKI